jgi:hypothetical protein
MLEKQALPVEQSQSEQLEPRTAASSAARMTLRTFSTLVWSGLLAVYLSHFAASSLAFLAKDASPGYEHLDKLANIQDQEVKAFVLDALKQEDTEYEKRRDFANQCFNVVLGALLGFLSASSTSLFNRDETPKGQS